VSKALLLNASAGRAAAALLAALLALAGCGGGKSSKQTTSAGSQATPPASRETSPGVVQAAAQGIGATMHASGHHPRVNKPWPVSFTVTQANAPARARLRYEYLFAGQVVAHRSNYGFRGSFHDTFVWPRSALGYPLTFRAVITSGKTTLNLDYAVKVIR
jgi:hypothetical protein